MSQFGLDPAQVAAMDKPVLIRKLDEDVDIAKAAVASNEGGGLGMSALEQARADADRLPDFGSFTPSESGELNTPANRGFIRQFVGQMPTTVQAQMVDAQGLLSQDGIRRLHNAMLYRAYGNSPALSRMVESTDQGARNMVNAMMQAAPTIAKARGHIASGDMHDADIAADIVAAVEKLNEIRESGGSVADYLAQQGMFEDDLSPVARDLVAFLDEHKRSAKAIATLLKHYYDLLGAQGSPNQADVFGDNSAPDRQQLLRKAEHDYRQQNEAPGQSGLFGQAAESAKRPDEPDSQARQQPAGSSGDETGAGEDAGSAEEQDGLNEDSDGLDEPDYLDDGEELSNEEQEALYHSVMFSRGGSLAEGGESTSSFEATAKENGGERMYAYAKEHGETELAYEQWVQVRTPEFKAWFGDWESLKRGKKFPKVLNPRTGEPLVVYHGTPNDFSEFSYDYVGTQGTADGQGFYFTDDALFTENYQQGSGKSMAVYLNIQHELSADKWTLTKANVKAVLKVLDPKGRDFLSNYGDVDYDGYNAVLNEAVEMELDGSSNDVDFVGNLINSGVEIENAYLALEKAVGASGIIAQQDDGSTHYVVGLRNQIKSATGNKGDFSRNNNDIRYSRSAMKDTAANIRRGREAMNRAMTERADVKRAMYRNDIGWVDFVWGDTGNRLANGKTKGAMGLSHIVDKRMAVDGMSYDEVIQMLTRDAVETIAEGKTTRRIESGKSVRLEVKKDGNTVQLTKREGSNTWLLTAFNDFENQAVEKVRGATQPNLRSSDPIRSRDGMGAPDTSDTLRASREQIKQTRQAVAQAVGKNNLRHIEIVARDDAARPDNAQDLADAQGWYDPQTQKITLIAEALPNKRTAQFVAWHELGHQRIDVDGFAKWRQLFAAAYNGNAVIKQAADNIMKQRQGQKDGAARNKLAAVEEAAADLFAAHQTGDYAAFEARNGVKVPAAMRQGLGGYLARLANHLRSVLAKVMGVQRNSISDADIYGWMKTLEQVDSGVSDGLSGEARYSRSEDTQAKYERRIDDLFAGKTFRDQVRVLDRSDLLDMLGYGDKPVVLVNSKVNADKHKNMDAAAWKKVPEWLDNPSMVFDSVTEQGRLVFVAPETVAGNVVRIILEPKADTLEAHVLVNAYDMEADTTTKPYSSGKYNPLTTFANWRDDGKLQYIDKEKTRLLASRSGLLLPGRLLQPTGMKKILTEKNLQGYRKSNPTYESGAKLSRGAGLSPQERRWLNEQDELQGGVKAYNKMAELLKPVFAKIKLADTSPLEFKQMMRDYRAQLNVAGRTAKEMADAGVKLTAEERKLLSDVLEKELPPGLEISPELQELAGAMREVLTQQSDDLVALQMLSEASRERFKDTYLPRLYQKYMTGDTALDILNKELGRAMRGSLGNTVKGQHLKGRGLFKEVARSRQAKYEAEGWEMRHDYGSKGKKANTVVMWRDYTREERAAMGEERDAMLRFTSGYIKTQSDIAKGVLFKRVDKRREALQRLYDKRGD
ncbi:hypothetical protein LVJ83_09815 [Uruburuella testudinis]|uniref:Phage MuF C-terminal domain-containing protein n=1 Tax=Uruburuella testudinis TaxID=1282863 RepID=A0ABY4DRB7_9NEIS|nr:hypothetical protein [Uruburuella testudinis]UOO81255.1 hypothetical protein LVJ83_09815 [Uruburuella testudinis]